MKKAIIKFLLGDAPPFWHFWDPRSGLAGGAIASVLIIIALVLTGVL